MSEDGFELEMTELVLEEKEIRKKIKDLEALLSGPETQLIKAEDLLRKAQAAHQRAEDEVKPLRSDKILLEGELERLEEKKAKCRVDSALARGKGVRPGTQDFVEQMQAMTGDPEENKLKAKTKELDLDAALAELKGQIGED